MTERRSYPYANELPTFVDTVAKCYGPELKEWFTEARERWSANFAAFIADVQAEPPLSEPQRMIMEEWFTHEYAPKRVSDGREPLLAIGDARIALLELGHRPSKTMLWKMKKEREQTKLSKTEFGDLLFRRTTNMLQRQGRPREEADAEATKNVANFQNVDVSSIYRRRTRRRKRQGTQGNWR